MQCQSQFSGNVSWLPYMLVNVDVSNCGLSALDYQFCAGTFCRGLGAGGDHEDDAEQVGQ